MAGGRGGGIVSRPFAVVHEAPADFQTAKELADRVLVESIEWLEADQIEYQRTWLQEYGGAPLTWKRVKRSALDARIDAIGFFDGIMKVAHVCGTHSVLAGDQPGSPQSFRRSRRAIEQAEVRVERREMQRHIRGR